MTEAISTVGLTKRYNGFTAVDHLDLEVHKGEVFGLLGPNGAGKTTTILMLLGLSEPAEGTARVVGLDPARNPLEVKRRVGYLPDNVGFYSGLTGRENLRYTAELNGIKGPEAESRIQRLIEQMGLADAGDWPSGTYSRGMRQRLGIADALVKDPEVLILDEPTVGIDPEGVQDMLDLIRTLGKERGVTVLLSSHLLYQVQAICDRVGIFTKGRLIAAGPISELASRLASAHVYVEVGAPETPGARSALQSVEGVERVDREGEVWLVTATRDVRYDISRALAGGGVSMFHLRRRGAELDDIYRLYFEAEERNGRSS